LNKGGLLFFELNQYQSDKIQAIVEEAGFQDVAIRHDLNGNPRLLRAVKK
jgi:release factor glutamine methyltransferase